MHDMMFQQYDDGRLSPSYHDLEEHDVLRKAEIYGDVSATVAASRGFTITAREPEADAAVLSPAEERRQRLFGKAKKVIGSAARIMSVWRTISQQLLC